MPDLLVRNVRSETMAFLKAESARNGRSVQAEVRELLEKSEEWNRRLAEADERAAAFRERMRGRLQPDSAELRHIGRP